MRIIVFFAALLLITGCTGKQPLPGSFTEPSGDRHMKNVTRLTDDGDNGEAYFSRDGKQLIFQSSRGGSPAIRSGP